MYVTPPLPCQGPPCTAPHAAERTSPWATCRRTRRRSRLTPRGGRRRSRRPSSLSGDAVEAAADGELAETACAGDGSALFREYYARQQILQGADDWRHFGQSMRSPLPVTFRKLALPGREAAAAACWSRGLALIAELERRVGEKGRELKWCDGFQIPLAKQQLRSHESAEVKAVQSWLVDATEKGLVLRQELVSMLPAVLLGVSPHHAVLDLCAAPGQCHTHIQKRVHLFPAATFFRTQVTRQSLFHPLC